MLTPGTGFARYSKSLCWIVSAICIALSLLEFTGGGASSNINGFLWLALAVAFACSASFITNSPSAAEPDEEES